MKRTILALAVALLVICASTLSGCVFSSVHANNPQQAILEVRQEYTIAVEFAAQYGSLPTCAPDTAVKIGCSTPAMNQQLKVAKDAAKPVIDGAEATVLDPNFDKSKTDAVVVSAQNALKVLTALTAVLKLK